jgi:Fe-S-cluster containining protein
MMNQTPTTKELLWLNCREKSCCHNSRVIITGRDMWRIAQAMELDPWEFTLFCEVLPHAVDGFQLVYGGPVYQVVLAKRGEVGPVGAPCLFLWQVTNGHHQCGLGGLRPLTCQSYPSLFANGMVCVDGHNCTCRRWSLLDVDTSAEQKLLEQVLQETAEYSHIVTTWNQNLKGQKPYAYQEFCAYVLETYTSRYGGSR